MNKVITIIDPNGQEKDVNLITFLTLEQYHQTYLVYTEKELTDGLNEVLFAKITEEEGKKYLENIESPAELAALNQEFKKELNK